MEYNAAEYLVTASLTRINQQRRNGENLIREITLTMLLSSPGFFE